MKVPSRIRRAVEERAGGRCEYCCMHQSLQGATFHVEHVVPVSRGGELDAMTNLAWACPTCNLHKADRLVFWDDESDRDVLIFNPRIDQWPINFRWDADLIFPLTAIGRVTAAALDLNHPRRIQIRRAEALFDLFPPDDP